MLNRTDGHFQRRPGGGLTLCRITAGMGNRGVQALLMVGVIIVAAVSAVAVNGSRGKNQTAVSRSTETPSPRVTSTPSATAQSTPSASPTVEPSPSESPTAVPTVAPTATTQPTGNGAGTGTTASNCSTAGSGGSGPAGYPPQVQAGQSYNYCGPRSLVSHATDTGETASGVCAGINESTGSFPGGYEGVFFVGVQFPDGNIVSAGYIADSSGHKDFGSIQNPSGTSKNGTVGSDPGPGSHTYCVNRTASGWATTRDGNTIYTASEGATTLNGATLKFDSDVEPLGSPAAQQFTFTVPGFHDILVGGAGPRQLRGAAFYS